MTFKNDPYRFTRYVHTKKSLPFFEDWQADVLQNISEPGFYSIKSGHSTGKSALAVWVSKWFLSTKNQPAVVCTSNTATQLSSKLWREMSVWNACSINKHWFEWTATKLALKANPSSHFAEAITWNEQKPEAFAGTHANDVLFIFDEASIIPTCIWETAYGAMMSGRCWFIVMGNPTKRGTEFERTFSSSKWKSWTVNSLDCKRTNLEMLQEMIDEYGIDSDYIKVRVLGEFPLRSIQQLISEADVNAAYGKDIHASQLTGCSRIIGADIAGFGINKSVFCCREGELAHSFDVYNKRDTMFLANALAVKADNYKPDMIFVDAGGIGQGVADRLIELGYPTTRVMFGSASPNENYGNMRAFMWDEANKWLQNGGAIPPLKELKAQLIKPDYFYNNSGV